MAPETHVRTVPVDGALDHILSQRDALVAAQYALYEIRQSALMHSSAPGPSGLLARTIIGIVDAATGPVTTSDTPMIAETGRVDQSRD